MSHLEKPGKDHVGVCVGAIVVDTGWVLLLKRKKEPERGRWCIQGGPVEFGETIEEAAKRKLKEELGVEAEIITLLGVTYHIVPEEGVHWVSPVFLVRITSGTPSSAEMEKHSEMRWFDLGDLPKEVTLTTENAVRLLRSVWKQYHWVMCRVSVIALLDRTYPRELPQSSTGKLSPCSSQRRSMLS